MKLKIIVWKMNTLQNLLLTVCTNTVLLDVSLQLQDSCRVGRAAGEVRSFTAKVMVLSHRPQNRITLRLSTEPELCRTRQTDTHTIDLQQQSPQDGIWCTDTHPRTDCTLVSVHVHASSFRQYLALFKPISVTLCSVPVFLNHCFVHLCWLWVYMLYTCCVCLCQRFNGG